LKKTSTLFLRPGLCRHFLFSIEKKNGLSCGLKNMGCLKLTYYPEPTLFLDEQAERTVSPKWRVWSRKESDFLGVDVKEQTQNCPTCPNPPAGSPPSSNDPNWLGTAAGVANIFGIGTTISVNGSRPMYTGPKEWAGQVKAGAKFGRRLGYLGVGLSVADMVINKPNTSNTLDATFGVVSFAGVPGAIIGGVYFGANLITEGITGKTIGQHVDDNFYIIPSGMPMSPFLFIPKN
jgi:hypothetical protein